MSKIRFNKTLLTLAMASAFSASAFADWGAVCAGPAPRTSTDYGVQGIATRLFAAVMGVSGTYTYNSNTATPPGCFGSTITGPTSGRIGFGAGLDGSVQTTLDDGMGFTWGFPAGVVGSSAYAIIREDNTPSLFGANGFNTSFRGASDTYFYGRTVNGNFQVDLRVDIVGDAARCNWKFTNLDTTASHTLALGYGSTVALFSETQQASRGAGPWGGTNIGPSGLPEGTYVTIPGYKPPRVEQRWVKSTDPAGYPSSVYFNFDQQNGYGIRVDNTANDATTDLSDPNQSLTASDAFVIGSAFFLLGWPSVTAPTDFQASSGAAAGPGYPNGYPGFIFQEPRSDSLFATDDGYIQFWNAQSVSPGGSRIINSFYRTTWGDSLYGKPYSVVVDTPKLINLSQADANTFAQNPFTIRVWVDNNRGFSTIDQELPLQDVQVQLLLPSGLTAVGASTKTINRIDARTQGFVDFTVQADDYAAGDLQYQVKISPTPGPQKTVTGTIQVVSQPKITLQTDANLVTMPWTFTSPTWETILNLVPDQDFRAFTWDPVQKGYLVSTGPDRGYGTWIVSNLGTLSESLGGSPTTPTDYLPSTQGAPLITLKPGWNLIGNPYHVAFQLGEMVGVSNANPSQSYTYADLVKQGIISGSLAFWDTGTQNYGFIQKASDKVEPQKGYWVYVYSSADVIIRYPVIYQVNVRSITDTSKPWQQTDKQWRLQLAARSKSSADTQNYVGIASSSANAKSLVVNEPPMAPLKSALSLSIDPGTTSTTKLAQSFADTVGRQEFTVNVDSREAGAVTVTWPNLSTIPKNVRVKLVDTATGETRDLRKVSGYTFNAEANLTRVFKIQIEPSTVSKAMIGAITVVGDTKAPGAAVRMSYTLTSDATTTVRILGNTGKQVAVLASGRADKAGQNEVVWNLRDQANRAVAPGTYRAEIVVEGADGERVRKITPIIVSR